jgi:hypothetical protein
MPTLPSPARVSLLAILALGACTSRTIARAGPEEAAPVRGVGLRFLNEGRDRVHVYLVGERREWLLGRVEPGTTAWLAMPLHSMRGEAGRLRLAVLAGAPPTLQAGRDPRAVQSMVQPATALLEREWSFAQGQLVSLGPRQRRAARR